MSSVDYPHAGTGWAFPVRWNDLEEGNVVAATASGLDKVKQSMEIIVRTDIGERRMRPRLGSNSSRFVFEPANDASVHQLAYFTERALKLFEPRIIVDKVEAVPDPDDGRVDIVVDFRMDRHRRPTSLIVPFYAEPGGEQ